MRQITKDISTLKESDMINALLYGLYKLTQDADYSAISTLAYTLDKDNLLNLCSIFGGSTIKIPTLEELRDITSVLMIIELMSKGMTFEEAYNSSDVDKYRKDEVIKLYNVFSEILNDY